jgi:acetylornithine deacetylase/succinyl-diaminopimelate desuccinylase-like protein
VTRITRAACLTGLTAAAVVVATALPIRAQTGTVSAPAVTALTVHGDPPDPVDVSAELKKVYAHIDANFDAHVARLQQWVRIPSVSNTVEGKPAVWDAARFIRDVIVKELGCPAQIYDPGIADWGAPGLPVVYGRCDVGAEKTLLLYAMGDAMPIYGREHAWTHEPFGAQLSERPPFKLVMNGRAASNNKGKDLGAINALLSIKAVTGTLPVNVIFVIEHDEERMDLGLRKFIFDHPELFKDADAVFGHGNYQAANGFGVLNGQSIGCVVFDLETNARSGGLWNDEQPLWRHMNLVTKLFDENGPLIKGLERDVEPVSAEEMAYYRRAAEQTNASLDELLRIRSGVRVTVTGTWSGGMEPGMAGRYTPLTATSKIDIRYPPNIDGEEVLRRVRAEISRLGHTDVTVKPVGIVPWSWANAETDLAKAAIRMFRQFGVRYVESPRGNFMPAGGSYYGPNALFSRSPLQLPVVVAGLGFGAGPHADNEFTVIKGDGRNIFGFAGTMKGFATILYNWAGKNGTTN